MAYNDGWTDRKIARLRELWDAGLKTTIIADDLGMSKNAIVGKAHRLGLVARPSPIKGRLTDEEKAQRWRAAQERRARGALVTTLPALGCEERPAAVVAMLAPPALPVIGAFGVVKEQPKPKIVVPPPAQKPVMVRRTSATCCWPTGTPGKPGFSFCEAPVDSIRSPYCTDHQGMAYVRVRKTAEDVATGALGAAD